MSIDAKGMNVLEAFDFTMGVVDDLKAEGVLVESRAPKSMNNPRLVEKYSGPDHLPVDRWLHVEFEISGEQDVDRVYDAAKRLGWMGISFDTCGNDCSLAWSLDWSFGVGDGPEDGRDETLDEVRDLQDKFFRKPASD